MKDILKRHAAVACLLICVMIITGTWMAVRFSADAGTYRIVDIEGDRAYLDGINIDMELSDMAHTQHMTLSNAEIRHTYQYQSQLFHQDVLHYDISQAIVEDKTGDVHVETETEMISSEDDYELWLSRMSRTADRVRLSVSIGKHYITGTSSQQHTVQVVTDVILHGDSQPFVFTLEREIYVHKNQVSQQGEPLPHEISEMPFSYVYSDEINNTLVESNPHLYAEAKDGTLYFTPPLSPNHRGTSAIYRVDEWGYYGYTEEPAMVDDYLTYSDFNAKSIGTVSKLVSFPVDGHQLRTVSLDVVNDRLCLLLIVDGVLTLRVYSTEGAFEYETPLFDVAPAQAISSMLFTNQSGDDTMLCYYLQDISSYEEEKRVDSSDPKLCCIRLGQNAELISILNTRKAIMHAAYIGKVWVLAEMKYKESYSYYDFYVYAPAQYYTSVLDSEGKSLYKGELLTDVTEDTIQYYLKANANDYANSNFTLNRLLYFKDISEE